MARRSGIGIRRVLPDELSGLLVKTLIVAPDQAAVVIRRGGKQQLLGPGHHRVATLGHWLWNGGRWDLSIIVADKKEFAVHIALDDILSADNELLEADFLLVVKPVDPLRLSSGGPEDTDDLRGRVVHAVRPQLQAIAHNYLASDLRSDAAVCEQIAGQLRSFLGEYLSTSGLEVKRVSHVAFRSAGEAVERARQTAALRARLREITVQEQLGQIDDAEMLRYRLKELGAEGLFTQAELEALWASVGRGKFTEQSLAETLEQKLREFDRRQAERFSRLEEQLGSLHEGVKPASAGRPRWWIEALNAVWKIMSTITTGYAIVSSRVYPLDRTLYLTTVLLGYLIAGVSLISAIRLNRRTLEPEEQARPAITREKRLQEDRLLRAKIEGALDKGGANLREVWTRAYREGNKELALSVRRLEQHVAQLRQEVQTGDYLASPYLTQERIAWDQLADVIELDHRLLNNLQQIAQITQDLHADLVDGEMGHVSERLPALEKALLEVGNRFRDREALLKTIR